jgi:outer membrane protein OmpA-like peptidoglycan-associated protein
MTNVHQPSRKRRLRWLLPGLIAIAVGCAVVVGRAATSGDPGFTIAGDAAELLQPGTAPQPLDLAFSNPNGFDLQVSQLQVSIASVDAPAAREGLPCTTADFAVRQFGGSYPFTIPAGGSTLASAGRAIATWPTVAMVETNRDQDGCKGATVHLSYSGSAFNPDQPVDTTPAGTTPTPTPSTTTTTTTTTTAPAVTTPVSTGPVSTGRKVPLTPPATGKGLGVTLVPTVQYRNEGGRAVFHISVRNASGVKLVKVAVADALAPACSRSLGTLAAGATKTYTCTRAKLHASFTNKVVASGRTTAGKLVTATASARVVVSPQPKLAILTLPKRQTSQTSIVTRTNGAGTTTSTSYGGAAFRIRVTNSGDVTLRGVRVADRLVPDCNRKLGTLAPGAVRTYSCMAVAIRRSFMNRAVASGTAAAGKVTAASRSRIDVHVERKAIGPRAKTGGRVEVVLTIPDVLFAFNRSEIRPGNDRILASILHVLQKRYPGQNVVVTGYTDSVGTPAYNLDLSRRRAATVALWLVDHGFAKNHVTVAFKGEADPIATNTTAAGRQKNRRVTITVKEAGL